jgi:hypothetical protein
VSNLCYYVLAILVVMSTIPGVFAASAVAFGRSEPDAGGEVRATAMYLASRGVALALLALVSLFGRFDLYLVAIAIAVMIVQILDIPVSIYRGRTWLAWGAAALAVPSPYL